MKKHLSSIHIVFLTVGSIVGSGIFIIPSSVAGHVTSPAYLILVWLVAGLITLTGVMTHAELTLYLPKGGGQYPIFKQIFGRRVAQAYGWAGLLNFNSGAIGGIAFVAALYLQPLTGLNVNTRILAIVLIGVFTCTNIISLKLSDGLQSQLTIVRILIIITLVVVTFVYRPSGDPMPAHVDHMPQGVYPFVLAIIGALWTYDGWNNFSYVSAEVVNIKRSLFKILSAGIGIVTLLYVMFNLALLHVFNIDQIAGAAAIGSSLVSVVLPGTLGEHMIGWAIVLCTVGSLHANIMACSRLPYHLGTDSRYLTWLAYVDPKTDTPVNALLVQALVACLSIWLIPFGWLTISIVLSSRVFYILSGSALLMQRRKSDGNIEIKLPVYIPSIFLACNILLIIIFLKGLFQS